MGERYSRNDLLKFDYPFEYYFNISIEVDSLPFEIIEKDINSSIKKIEKKLLNGYSLIIQMPSFPNQKEFLKIEVIKRNATFKLFKLNYDSFNSKIVELLYENEYRNDWTFFLIKTLDHIDFKVSESSSVENNLKISGIENNEIIFLRMESNKIIKCKWD